MTRTDLTEAVYEAIGIPLKESDAVVCDADTRIDRAAADTRERSWQVLRKGGILVSITGHPDQAKAASHGVRATYASAGTSPEVLQLIADLYESGRLRPHVSHVFPLEQAREAHDLSQRGHTRGKIVLSVGQ